MSMRSFSQRLLHAAAAVRTPAASLVCASSILAGTLIGQAGPAAAQDLPDLTIRDACCFDVLPGTTGVVTLAVSNLPGVRKVFDPSTRTYLPEPYYVTASNVSVRVPLPAGWTYVGSRADHGFACSSADSIVTCTGGTIAGDELAEIDLRVTAPLAPMYTLYPVPATVDPTNTIAERSETNNTGTQTLRLAAPIG